MTLKQQQKIIRQAKQELADQRKRLNNMVPLSKLLGYA